MTIKIPIRNKNLPKSPRVFDVTVEESDGRIIRYDMQNIKGNLYIEENEVKRQIQEALSKQVV